MIKKVTAIVRTDALEDVESRLRGLGVPGVTVSRVKGFGEYANFFTPDWKSAHARVEIFIDEAQVQFLVDTIMATAHSGLPGDGIVAVAPVDDLYRIRDYHRLESLPGRRADDDAGHVTATTDA